MEKLPRDVALDIFSRLPITSLMQIKCVCRSWRALGKDPRLLIMYQAIANKRNPCLILHCDSSIQNNLHFVESSQIRHHGHYTNNARRINAQIRYVAPEFHVVGSCNGLLCISNALYIRLPNTTQYPKQQEVAFRFGFHPTTMEYKIVWISYLNNYYQGHQLPLQSRVQVLTLGSNAWRISVSPRCELDQGSSEALVNGNLHWVTTRHKHRPGPCLRIVCFDLAEEKFREIESPGCGILNICNFHLVVLGGCLSAVVCHDDGKIDIWIMKEYGSKESWTKDYVIGESLFRSLSERRNSRPSSRVWKRPTLSRGKIQVLCSLRNGEMLLEYENGVLVSYNTESQEFQQLMIHGLPKWFCTIFHFETLYPADVRNSSNAAIGTSIKVTVFLFSDQII
ncbi:PREDICTED: F-box protein At3g07870-like [Prunus mume]|uniref:F-box protein At3g07870-like n=1 Tax=Prunus mume TaxID=102107 RepID=A0ABM0NV97_PRUMU|nr:PREDICTED: F-box protein At3g07870-like [Prunus mume]